MASNEGMSPGRRKFLIGTAAALGTAAVGGAFFVKGKKEPTEEEKFFDAVPDSKDIRKTPEQIQDFLTMARSKQNSKAGLQVKPHIWMDFNSQIFINQYREQIRFDPDKGKLNISLNNGVGIEPLELQQDKVEAVSCFMSDGNTVRFYIVDKDGKGGERITVRVTRDGTGLARDLFREDVAE
ncbi:MAG: hypothetical protein Q7S01_06455 [bacterium]|nr:hypothetical protein [bacterium]